MKPRLPLSLFGLAFACAMPLQAAGNAVSINFTSGNNATYDAGASWYDAAGNSGSVVIAADGDHDSSYTGGGAGIRLDYSSKNSWEYTTDVADNMLKGYLDDGGSGISISLSGLIQHGYLTYDLTIYAATDNAPATGGAFTSKIINGVNYTSDGNGGATAGSTAAWGTARQTTVGNANSFTVSGLTGDLTIASSGSDQNPRGCISGIVVTNTYAGTRVEVSLDNSSPASWTTTDLSGSAWSNVDSYAAFTVAGDNTLAVEAGVRTDALIVTGNAAASSLTLNGGDLTLEGPGVISAGDGVTLTVNSTVTSEGIVTLDGAQGRIIVGGSMNVNGLQGTGNLTIAEGGAIAIGGDAASSFGGTLAVADWTRLSDFLQRNNANWTFNGVALFNETNAGAAFSYGAVDAFLSNATLQFEGTTLTLAGGDNVTHKIVAETVTKTGAGTAVIGNAASTIDTLNIEGGTVELNRSGYGIGTVNVADGGILSFNGTSTNIGGAPTINLADGSGMDFRNSGSGGGNNTLTASIVINTSEAAKGVSIGGSYYGGGTTLAGSITGTGSLAFKNSLINGSATNDFTVSAVISDKSASEQLRVVLNKPSSYINLTGANTYSGGTDIQSGKFVLSGNGTVGTGTVSIAAGGSLSIGRNMTYDNVTSGNGSFIVTGGTVKISRGDLNNWQNSFADFHGTIDIAGGTLQLGLANDTSKSNTAAGLGDGTIKIGSGAVLALGTGIITLGNAMELADNSRINVLDGANNVPANYTLSGRIQLAGTTTINHSWDKSFKITGLLEDTGDAHGKLVLSGNAGGRFLLSGDNNTFSGGIALNNGKLYAEGNESLGAGTTTLAAGTELHFTKNGGNASSATILAGNAATLSAQTERDASAPLYANVKITSTGIARSNADNAGSVAKAALNVSSTYSVEKVDLNDVQITLNENAALTLTDVTLGAGTTLAKAAGVASTSLSVNNAALILDVANATIGSDATSSPTTALVSYDMAGAAVNGSFTLDFTGELLRALAAQAGNPFTQIRITLNDVSSWSVAEGDLSVAASHYYLRPGSPTVDASHEGQVVVTIAFDEMIPEPATATLGLTALLGLMLRRRRK